MVADKDQKSALVINISDMNISEKEYNKLDIRAEIGTKKMRKVKIEIVH